MFRFKKGPHAGPNKATFAPQSIRDSTLWRPITHIRQPTQEEGGLRVGAAAHSRMAVPQPGAVFPVGRHLTRSSHGAAATVFARGTRKIRTTAGEQRRRADKLHSLKRRPP